METIQTINLKKSRSQLLVESEKNKSTKEQSGKEGK